MKRDTSINDLCLHCTREDCDGICDELRAANGPINLSKRAMTITWKGYTRTVPEWAEILNIAPQTLYYRIRKGLEIDDIMSNKVVVVNLVDKPAEWYEIVHNRLTQMHLDYILYWDRPKGIQDSTGMVTHYNPIQSAPTNKINSLTEMRAIPEAMMSDDALERCAWIQVAMDLLNRYRRKGAKLRYDILQLRAFQGFTLRRIVEHLNDERIRPITVYKARKELNTIVEDMMSLAYEKGLLRVTQK